LLLLNNHPKGLAYGNILGELVIDEGWLKGILMCLCHKVPILKRSKKSKEPHFDEDEIIIINYKFKCKAKKVRIDHLAKRITTQ